MGEQRRGCGYRKVGGLYLVSGGGGHSCCKMPFVFEICPACAGGIKQSRSFQWIDPQPWLAGDCTIGSQRTCPAADPKTLGNRVGLMWVGAKFYPTPADFADEGRRMGFSRRIKAIPRGFEIGNYVFLAHPRLRKNVEGTGWVAGVFYIWRPDRIEKIVTDLDAQDEAAMQALVEKGITPVVVPHDDQRHQGSVYEDDQEELPA